MLINEDRFNFFIQFFFLFLKVINMLFTGLYRGMNSIISKVKEERFSINRLQEL